MLSPQNRALLERVVATINCDAIARNESVVIYPDQLAALLDAARSEAASLAEQDALSWKSEAAEAVWDDCKIAFALDWSDECDALTDGWCERPTEGFPSGWEFDGVDFTGARAVAIFRVTGYPTKGAAETILAKIRALSAPLDPPAKVEGEGSSQSRPVFASNGDPQAQRSDGGCKP